MTMDDDTIEVEAKFEIVHPEAKIIIDKLATIKQLGEFRIEAGSIVRNLDIYFDTSNLDLALLNGSLRTRLISGKDYVVTLKLKRTSINEENVAAFDRVEIEGDPSSEILGKIWNRLQRLNLVGVDFNAFNLYKVGVEGLFQSWGFQELFRAENQRITRAVFDVNDNPVAYLSIDDVTFFTPNKNSKFHELEIEVMDDSKDILDPLTSSILSIFPKYLVPSRKSKYERGLEFISLEDDNKTEIKLAVRDLDLITRELQIEREMSGYQVRTANSIRIFDEYYDTSEPEFSLRSNNCYLRLRTVGDKRLLTFRNYREDGEGNTLQAFQIKQPASKEILIDTVKYLLDIGVLNKNTHLNRKVPEDLHDALATFGLYKKLDAAIDRLIFPIYDRDEYFANIKVDRVVFSFGEKTFKHQEIEVSTESQTPKSFHRIQSLAYGLMSRFELRSLRKPKYLIGLEGIQGITTKSDSNNLYIPIHRRTELDLAKSVSSVVEVVETPQIVAVSQNEANKRSIEALAKSLELAIDRTRDTRKLQIAMALTLFGLGLGIILASIIMATQGGLTIAQALAGVLVGGFVNLFIYFPFRKISELTEIAIELTTLSAKMEVSLTHLGDDPVAVKEYLDAMWASLARK